MRNIYATLKNFPMLFETIAPKFASASETIRPIGGLKS
jgi:hypothetical protein